MVRTTGAAAELNVAKKKSGSELEHLRGIVRQMKSELRHMKKEVARKTKREHLYEERIVEEYEQEIRDDNVYIKKEECPECGNAIDTIDLGTRIIITCTDCKYRTSRKK